MQTEIDTQNKHSNLATYICSTNHHWLLIPYRYELMTQCWQLAPTDRPSFDQIITRVEEYLEDLKQYFNPDDNSEEPFIPYYNLRSNKDSVNVDITIHPNDLANTEMSSSGDEVFQHGSGEGVNGSILLKKVSKKGGDENWSTTVFV